MNSADKRFGWLSVFITDLGSLAARLADRIACSGLLELTPGYQCAGQLESKNSEVESSPLQVLESQGAVIYCDAATWTPTDLSKILEHRQAELKGAKLFLIAGPESPPCKGSDSNLAGLLQRLGLDTLFQGWTRLSSRGILRRCQLILSQGSGWFVRSQETPRVVALMAVYNEVDIVSESLDYLAAQGIQTYIIDNWSTDGSFEIVRNRLGRGVLGLERFPPGGRGDYFQIGRIIRRKEVLSRQLDADWFLNTDVDEFRESPFLGVGLVEAIGWADASGFNCIDHTLIDFVPRSQVYDRGRSCIAQFKEWRPGFRDGHFVQKKLWKKQECDVDLFSSGAHEARFPGRRVFPFNFLLRHYTLRSIEHAANKYTFERRIAADDLARKWGMHYLENPFAGCDPRRIEAFPFGDFFYTELLAERLTSFGQSPPEYFP